LPICRKGGSTILEKAIEYCWDDEFLNVFRGFFARHAYAFQAVMNE
jgi:hypothetical protein